MVIAGPEPIVVDTGTAVNREQWFEDVFSIVDPEDIRYVFLSHDDHDHTGNLLPLLDAAPQATLVTTWFSVERLAGDMSIPLDRMRWVNDGEHLRRRRPHPRRSSDRPLYDSPVTRGLYDPATGVLLGRRLLRHHRPAPRRRRRRPRPRASGTSSSSPSTA